ncbi:MAG: fumarylacetoacetate hydrolase family protein [Hyphomicrobiales bacterium]|nr:MAG: fumarylacetoacetate hydrolase family protein [Hyphomicrobiales bacterium]
MKCEWCDTVKVALSWRSSLVKLVAFRQHGNTRLGIVEGDSVVVGPSHLGDVVDVIVAGQSSLDALQACLADSDGPRLPLDGLDLVAPIRRFRRDILCTGWNYRAHFDESVGQRGDHEVERPAAPTFFTKGPDTVIGPRDAIAFDSRLSGRWDYEGEIAVIIGRDIFSPSAAEAEAAVFGYCLANDISQRDLQRRHGGQWLKGKSIDGTMPLGPFIVTADDVDLDRVTLESFVNGEKRQGASAAQMAFPIGELLAELAYGMSLRAGDVVLTGTPAGIGSARTPPTFLADGDEIVVRATGLGELRNVMRAADLVRNSPVAAASGH